MFILVNPVIISYSQAKIQSLSVKAVNRSIYSLVTTETYRSLVDIRYDSSGKITSLTTDMFEMNKLGAEIAAKSQKEIDTLAAAGIGIPIGTFSGLPILTGKGPAVTIRIVPVGSIACTFASDFESAGFNQTRHRIILKVHSKVNLIMPLVTRTVQSDADILLCESIIVGEVPSFLWNS